MSINLEDYLPSVADFPRPGVVFRDICPLLAHPPAFAECIDRMAAATRGWRVDRIGGIETRGLVFASALSLKTGVPLAPVRKPGKLPPPVAHATYALEYGTDTLEMQRAAVRPGERVLLVDDVIATGGTLLAAASLVRELGGEVAGVIALLDIAFLGGAARLRAADLQVSALLTA